MELILKPYEQNNKPCSSIFMLTVTFDDDMKAEQQRLGMHSFGAMSCCDLIGSARQRAAAFIKQRKLKVLTDNTTLFGVDMVVYLDLSIEEIAKLPVPEVERLSGTQVAALDDFVEVPAAA